MLRWLQARAENVAVALLAAMFIAFVLQIAGRYVLNDPPGWTLEFCLMMWIWVVFWGCAFCVREQDHVRFDMFYGAVPPRVRRAFGIVSALAIIAALGISLPAAYDWIDFLRIKRSATLRIPLGYVYSVYLIFAVAVIVRYGWGIVQLVRGVPESDSGR